MTLWLVLLAVWLVGIPASVLMCALLGVGYDQHRLARLARTRAAIATPTRSITRPRDCNRRMHLAARDFHRSVRRSSGRGSAW
jgi:hypothetical protein